MFLLGAVSLLGQNLVLNPSFEEGAFCDGTTERIDTVVGWSAVAGNPGYINPNCPLSKESRSFVQGMRLPPASHGNVLSVQKFDLEGEFQQGMLITPLEAGRSYVVKMRVRSPIQFCNTPISEVGVLLTKEALEHSKDQRRIDIPALSLQNNSQTPITEQYKWEEITALYHAEGGEKFITIGNFSSINVGSFDNRTAKECTYLFIDMVSVEEFKGVELVSFVPKMAIKKEERLLVKEIEFEAGKAVLKGSSDIILKELSAILLENTAIKMKIICYSDNSLDEMESRTFTKARARSVAAFLEEQGVSSSQLIEEGLGSANAIALNSLASGRSKNERVEVIFVEL